MKEMFSDEEFLTQYQPAMLQSGTNEASRVKSQNENVKLLLRNLLSIRDNLDLVPDNVTEGNGSVAQVRGESVFIVHGRGTLKDAVARIVSDACGREPKILQEQLDSGSPTVIEKFEAVAADVGWAVVVMTGDDEGRLKGSDGPLQPRTRQNVVAELGFFVGRLGRERVKVLYEAGVEMPSDFLGVVYIALDDNDAWRSRLKDELLEMSTGAGSS